jgi:uncharacterized protein (DUF1330 family)
MAAYIIGKMKVTNPDRYAEYRAHVSAILQKHGGRFLVRGGEVSALEGPAVEGRVVVAEFPSMDALQKFWNSPEYQRLVAIRQEASESEIWAVAGV